MLIVPPWSRGAQQIWHSNVKYWDNYDPITFHLLTLLCNVTMRCANKPRKYRHTGNHEMTTVYVFSTKILTSGLPDQCWKSVFTSLNAIYVAQKCSTTNDLHKTLSSPTFCGTFNAVLVLWQHRSGSYFQLLARRCQSKPSFRTHISTIIKRIVITFSRTFMVPRGWIPLTLVVTLLLPVARPAHWHFVFHWNVSTTITTPGADGVQRKTHNDSGDPLTEYWKNKKTL